MNIYGELIKYYDGMFAVSIGALSQEEFDKWCKEILKPRLDRRFARYQARKQLTGDSTVCRQADHKLPSGNLLPEIFWDYLE
jgi:hypothetical protein